MRIYEVLFWNDEATEENRTDPQLDLPPSRFDDDPTNLANAFTRSGLVKHFWNLSGSAGQPPGPAPPDAGTELIPSGMLEPTTASWQAEPVETECPVLQNLLVPVRQKHSRSAYDPATEGYHSDGRDVVNGGTKSAAGHSRRSAVLAALPHP
jgi:hypothetical protein